MTKEEITKLLIGFTDDIEMRLFVDGKELAFSVHYITPAVESEYAYLAIEANSDD